MGCRLGDPCWEGFAARVLGLVHQDQPELALQWLRDAVSRTARVPDHYVWLKCFCLEAVAAQEIERGDREEADAALTELETLAARGDMRELIVRAAIHRSHLSEPTALTAVRPLVDTIGNPALEAELAAV